MKLLKHVDGIGRSGQVVTVSPSFFNNKLRPTRSAQLIIEKSVQEEQHQAEAQRHELEKRCLDLRGIVSQTTIGIHRKVGPDGKLYGGVGPRLVMDELFEALKDDILRRKEVTIASIQDIKGNEVRNNDIRETGRYEARLNLTSGISATFKINIEPVA